MLKRLLFVACCTACSKASPPPPAVTPPPAVAPAGSPADAAVAVVPATAAFIAPKLVIGGEPGISSIGDDGKVTKVLSKTSTSHPRWTPDHKALVFLSESGELRRLELATGTETVITTLPASITPCPGTTIERSTLAIQDDRAFGFDKTGKSICVRLQDRNDNMVNVAVSYIVDVATGKAAQTIDVSECPKDPKVPYAEGCFTEFAPPAKPIAKPFTIVKGKLVHDGKAGPKLGNQGDFTEDEVSPSGKWAVISGNNSQGDYMHSDLFLLDRDAGTVFPIPRAETTTPWPAPIPAGQLAKLETWSEKTTGAVGESTIVWLGDDMLIIDHLLVMPGKQLVRIDGDLAR